MPLKTPIRILLTSEERAELESIARGLAILHRTVVRAKIVLALADGATVSATAAKLATRRRIVQKWGKRFLLIKKKRMDGLADDPRSGRPPRFSPGGGHASGEARV
jgi:hypothetical protein